MRRCEMIQITFHKTRTGDYQGFTCSGHAGYAAYGEDIVCAAVSALVINTINSLEEITGEEMEVTAEENSGLIRCFCQTASERDFQGTYRFSCTRFDPYRRAVREETLQTAF